MSQILVLFLSGVIFAGFVMILYGTNDRSLKQLIVFGLLATFAGAVGVGIVEWLSRPALRWVSQPRIDEPIETSHTSESPILNYRSPPSSPRIYTGPNGCMIGIQAMGGVVVGIGGIVLMASTTRSMAAVAIVPIVGIAILFAPGIRGFGIGVVLAIPFAMLLLIAACGF